MVAWAAVWTVADQQGSLIRWSCISTEDKAAVGGPAEGAQEERLGLPWCHG